MTKYGDFFPSGDRLPDPNNYLTPHQVGQLALANAEELLAAPVLNLSATEMHMRAFAGLYNGFGNLDEQTYNRLNTAAKSASQETSGAIYDYFLRLGRKEEILDELAYNYPNAPSQRDQDGFFLNKMPLHVSMLSQRESRRDSEVLRRGVLPMGSPLREHDHFRDWPVEDPLDAEKERIHSPDPYSVQGIRDVLKVYGRNLGPFIESFAEVAPLNIDRRFIVHHATGSLQAARVGKY